jgi:Fic family protein
VAAIRRLLLDYKHRIREALPKIYSQDLINNIFSHPYTKIQFVENDLGVSRLTATKYLDRLTESGFLVKQKVGRVSYYINTPLYEILTAPGMQSPDE